jgi:prepilin-type processing-associated H-X9-DG protein
MKIFNQRWLEWVVMVAVMVFAIAVLFTVAKLTRGRTKIGMCTANLNVLGRSWMAYAEDNDGLLVGGSNYYNDMRSSPYRWVEVPLFKSTDNPEKYPIPNSSQFTLEYRLNGIRAGKLFSYTQDTRIYHCPADQSWVKRAAQQGPYRSYAIGGLMNAEDCISRNGKAGPITGYRSVHFPTGETKQLIVAERMIQIQQPAKRYVFVEEEVLSHAQQENMGSFVLMAGGNANSWYDWPAVFHTDRGMLGFADGHVEGHVWMDQRTIQLIQAGDMRVKPVQPNNPDLEWMVKGYLAAEP